MDVDNRRPHFVRKGDEFVRSAHRVEAATGSANARDPEAREDDRKMGYIVAAAD